MGKRRQSRDIAIGITVDDVDIPGLQRPRVPDTGQENVAPAPPAARLIPSTPKQRLRQTGDARSEGKEAASLRLI
jgi:hypothetical protein